ncbi:hypothetical protein ACFW2T_13745 [Streptomyces sp. NPDC058892]|uniref:hypothetical protein n=1 Tax=unclassified Streptomyces TaxID=2593676 RepID=UPI0004472BF7|nr:hypothetical protein [Streptomyces sp. PCS3-D2]WKV75884.1 hypothetical protein AW27_032790 [Streptomyces sp. PCS3-D2]
MASQHRHQHYRSGRAADRHARAAATRWRHDGSEPRWARSDLRLRRLLSLLFAPFFALIGVLMLLLGSGATGTASPPRGLYTALAVCCFLLALVALVDLYVIRVRRREQQRWHRPS